MDKLEQILDEMDYYGRNPGRVPWWQKEYALSERCWLCKYAQRGREDDPEDDDPCAYCQHMGNGGSGNDEIDGLNGWR